MSGAAISTTKLPQIDVKEAMRRHLLSDNDLQRMGLVSTAKPVAKGLHENGETILYYRSDKVKIAAASTPTTPHPPQPETEPLPTGEPKRISTRRAEMLGYFSKDVLAHMYYEPTEPPVAYYIRRSGERVDLYRRAACRRLPLPCVLCGADRYHGKLCRTCYEKERARRRAEGDARRHARYGLAREQVLFFDMEMTGVFEQDEVLSVSIVDGTGKTIFHSLVRPVRKKHWKRTEEIHGITPEMVQNSPTFEELSPLLRPIFENAKRLIAYGTSTDFIHLRRLCTTAGAKKDMKAKLLDCATEFSRYVKEHEIELVHQSLSDAMAHFGLTWEGIAHNSLADAHACRLVFQTLFPNFYESEVSSMDQFFGLDEAALQEEGVSHLTTVYDEVLASLYEALLKEKGIPHLKKDRSGGTAVRILMGTSMQGIDFYVPERYLESAKELLFTPEAEMVEEDET